MDGDSSDTTHKHHSGGWGWGWGIGLVVLVLLVVFFVWWVWCGNNNNNNCCPPPSYSPSVTAPSNPTVADPTAPFNVALNTPFSLTGANLQRITRLTVYDSTLPGVYEVENFTVNTAGTTLTFYPQHIFVTTDEVHLYFAGTTSPITATF